MGLLLIALVCVGLLYILRLWVGGVSLQDWPFRKKDYLLTRAERSLFEMLCQAAGTGLYVFAKVRLADLVWLRRGISHRQRLRNRMIAKHIDFVLCEHSMLRPVLAIELDDGSHSAPSRVARDEVVRRVLNAAGLPLLRVPVSRGYVLGNAQITGFKPLVGSGFLGSFGGFLWAGLGAASTRP